jgi:DHA3 family macrolide efflux protein-like MFS transporter
MLIGGIVGGLILGLLLGGRLEHLARAQLRYLPLLFIAVLVRFATEAALGAGVEPVEALRLPLLVTAYGLLLVALWHNRGYPGLALAFVGIAGNAIAITLNGGYMPIWEPSLSAAGWSRAELTSVLHVVLESGDGTDFLLHAGPLGDVIPVPFPLIRNVASIGDLFLSAGLGFFLFATLVRVPADEEEAVDAEARLGRLVGLAGTARPARRGQGPDGGLGVPSGTGLADGLSGTAALRRPLVLGGSGVGMASPALAPLPVGQAAGAIAVPGRPALTDRLRRHPYIRLAVNGSFSALWNGQMISLFGDRIHQVALAFLVYSVTDSALAVGLVFMAATLPNLLLSPVAGVYVDRWDHQEVLVVSDLLRAAAVLLIPVAVLVNVWLAYPLVFAVTAISIFFRPARVAILPQIVREDDLLPANSALWVGETLADVVGYPLAGLFVVFLADALPVAFWLDAATYVGSAVLLGSMSVPKSRGRPWASRESGGSVPGPEGVRRSAIDDLKVGWRFLRQEQALLANTLQGSAGQFAIGIVTALAPVYAAEVLAGEIDGRAAYAFLETAIGVGNLAGGFVLGLVAARVPRGRLVILGYSVFGACIAILGLVSALPLAIGLMAGVGVANMVFVIPSQTMFQERTPPELIGRVIGFRFALVFGSMTMAMGLGGILAEFVGPSAVILAAGLLSLGAGLVGLAVPAVRDA